MRNLAPPIHRRRLVIEGMAADQITATDITSYLSALPVELDLIEILAPVMHRPELYGWAAHDDRRRRAAAVGRAGGCRTDGARLFSSPAQLPAAAVQALVP